MSLWGCWAILDISSVMCKLIAAEPSSTLTRISGKSDAFRLIEDEDVFSAMLNAGSMAACPRASALHIIHDPGF